VTPAAASLADQIKQKFPRAWVDTPVEGEVHVRVDLKDYREFSWFLSSKDGCGLTYLSALTAVDFQDKLQLVLLVTACQDSAPMVEARVDLPRDDPKAPSVTSFWPGANWPEREVFDLFGVEFDGHPDLRTILLPENFKGYPLRKDFEDLPSNEPALGKGEGSKRRQDANR